MIGPAKAAGDDVVDFQVPRVATFWPLAFVAGMGQSLPAHCWSDGSRIVHSRSVNLTVTLSALQIFLTDFQFAFAGLNTGFAAFFTLVDVDLNGWFALTGKVRPGGLFWP